MEHDRQIAQPDFTSVMLVHILLDEVDRIRRMRLRRKCFRHTTSSRILKRAYGMQNRLFCGNPVKGGAADIALCRCVPIEIVHIQRSICRPGIDHADRLRTHAHTQRENPVTDLLRLRNRCSKTAYETIHSTSRATAYNLPRKNIVVAHTHRMIIHPLPTR